MGVSVARPAAGRLGAACTMLGGMTPCAMSRGAAMMRAMTDVSVRERE